MKKGLRLAIVAAGTVFLLFATSCATSKKSNCHCPSWGKEIHKGSALQKSS